MALLDLQALALSSELNGGYDGCHGDHNDCCGNGNTSSGLSLLLCSG